MDTISIGEYMLSVLQLRFITHRVAQSSSDVSSLNTQKPSTWMAKSEVRIQLSIMHYAFLSEPVP